MSRVPPDVEALAQRVSDRAILAELGDARLIGAAPGDCEVKLPWRPPIAGGGEMRFQRGAVASFAELCGWLPVQLCQPVGSIAATADLRIAFLAPPTGECLRARSRILRVVYALVTTEVRIEAVMRGATVHCATALATVRSGRDATRDEREAELVASQMAIELAKGRYL